MNTTVSSNIDTIRKYLILKVQQTSSRNLQVNCASKLSHTNDFSFYLTIIIIITLKFGENQYTNMILILVKITKRNNNLKLLHSCTIPRYAITAKNETAIDVNKLFIAHFGSNWKEIDDEYTGSGSNKYCRRRMCFLK